MNLKGTLVKLMEICPLAKSDLSFFRYRIYCIFMLWTRVRVSTVCIKILIFVALFDRIASNTEQSPPMADNIMTCAICMDDFNQVKLFFIANFIAHDKCPNNYISCI